MARAKNYVVRLNEEEQEYLTTLISRGVAKARMISRARILLLAHRGWSNSAIAAALQLSDNTVWSICKRFVQEGVEASLNDRSRPGAKAKLDGKQEAFLVALACSEAPQGKEHWTMQLLADRLVELGVVDEISDETVRRVLKKTTSSPGRKSSGALAK